MRLWAFSSLASVKLSKVRSTSGRTWPVASIVSPLSSSETAERGVSRRIGRKRRSEIRLVSSRVAGRRAEGSPILVADRHRIAVDLTAAHAQHRPPEGIVILGVPGRDARVSHGDVHQGKQPGVLRFCVVLLNRYLPHHLVVEAGRSS
jgi:hypothetical protein